MSESSKKEVFAFIQGNVELPVMPIVASRIVEECENPSVTAEDLGRIIQDDLALTGRLLKVANSPMYRRRIPADTIQTAVVRVGLKQIKDMALGLCSKSLFNRVDETQKHVWEHSMASALAAQTLADLWGECKHAFVAGLMHDVGRVVLTTAFPERFAAAIELSSEKDIPSWEAEKEEFSFSHAEVGSLLANRWRVDPQIADAIYWHHDYAKAEKRGKAVMDLTCIVNLAEGMANSLGIGLEVDALPEDTELAEWPSAHHLGLQHKDIGTAMDLVRELFLEERALFD